MLVIVSFLACLALAWWQWSRFESGGTGQNLGYALQWPLFAAFVIYAYRRFVQLEAQEADPSSKPAKAYKPREIPADLLPQRPAANIEDDLDPQMREYNKYLAELAARDTKRSTT